MPQPNITCIIVDDEPKMIELLADSINELYPQISISGKYTEWKQALTSTKSLQPDILFMDISMPEKSGFDLLELMPNLQAQVIFVTAHTEFAVEAFDFDVCGYVLKPISDKQLIKAVDRALKKIEGGKEVKQSGNSDEKIGIPDDGGIRYVNIRDIIYCETHNRYTKVVTTEGEILSSYNIGKYQETLTQDYFFQLHRSFIVNLNHVKRYDTSGLVVMNNGTYIPIAKTNKEMFLQRFNRVGR